MTQFPRALAHPIARIVPCLVAGSLLGGGLAAGLAASAAAQDTPVQASMDVLCTDHPRTCSLLEQASVAATDIVDPMFQAQAQAAIALAYAELGLMDIAEQAANDAFTLARSIEDESLRTLALEATIPALIAAEDGTTALAAVALFPHTEQRTRHLVDSARAFIAAEHWDEAAAIADILDNATDSQDRELVDYLILLAQARAGLLDQARAGLPEIADADRVNYVLRAIAEVEAGQGRWDDALATVAAMRTDEEAQRTGALLPVRAILSIARVQAAAGAEEEASTTLAAGLAALDRSPVVSPGVVALAATVEADLGRTEEAQATFQEAVSVARRIEREYRRATRIADIGRAQMHAGFAAAAAESFQEANDILAALPNNRGIGPLIRIAGDQMEDGLADAARASLLAAADAVSHLPTPSIQISHMFSLAQDARRLGLPDLADEFDRRTIALAEATDLDAPGADLDLHSLALSRAHLGDWEGAAAAVARVPPRYAANIQSQLAVIAAEAEDWNRALTLAGEITAERHRGAALAGIVAAMAATAVAETASPPDSAAAQIAPAAAEQ
ncbi:MAG: hypothetical protein H6843_15105 [Rhodospirillaceae bacterium]|nr:hypothetical protein [Rhodospirillaceae bacterium]